MSVQVGKKRKDHKNEHQTQTPTPTHRQDRLGGGANFRWSYDIPICWQSAIRKGVDLSTQMVGGEWGKENEVRSLQTHIDKGRFVKSKGRVTYWATRLVGYISHEPTNIVYSDQSIEWLQREVFNRNKEASENGDPRRLELVRVEVTPV